MNIARTTIQLNFQFLFAHSFYTIYWAQGKYGGSGAHSLILTIFGEESRVGPVLRRITQRIVKIAEFSIFLEAKGNLEKLRNVCSLFDGLTSQRAPSIGTRGI